MIYIGGYGRSGSTLLERIIASHPNITGCGELHNLLEDFAIDEKCGCGKSASECEIYKDIGPFLPQYQTNDLSYLIHLYSAGIVFIIDSSKTTNKTSLRPVHLEKSFDIYFIYLNRKLKGVLSSQLRAKKGLKPWILITSCLSRFFANLQALYYTHHFNKSLKVQYEDLVTEPEMVKERISEFLGLSFGHISLPRDAIPTTHQLSGNVIRYTEPLFIKK